MYDSNRTLSLSRSHQQKTLGVSAQQLGAAAAMVATSSARAGCLFAVLRVGSGLPESLAAPFKVQRGDCVAPQAE